MSANILANMRRMDKADEDVVGEVKVEHFAKIVGKTKGFLDTRKSRVASVYLVRWVRYSRG